MQSLTSCRTSAGKYKTGMWEEGGGAYITPLAGSPYLVRHACGPVPACTALLKYGLSPPAATQVWPVIHSRLTRRGLKSITAEEVCAFVD